MYIYLNYLMVATKTEQMVPRRPLLLLLQLRKRR